MLRRLTLKGGHSLSWSLVSPGAFTDTLSYSSKTKAPSAMVEYALLIVGLGRVVGVGAGVGAGLCLGRDAVLAKSGWAERRKAGRRRP